MFKTLLIATDLTDASLAALRAGLAMGNEFLAQVYVLHCTELAPPGAHWYLPYAQIETELLRAWDFRFDDAAKRKLEQQIVEANGKHVDWTRVRPMIRRGIAADLIIQAARELPASLVVMGTHGRTGIDHALLGSIAERVVRTAPCPVLTIRAPKEAEHQVAVNQ